MQREQLLGILHQKMVESNYSLKVELESVVQVLLPLIKGTWVDVFCPKNNVPCRNADHIRHVMQIALDIDLSTFKIFENNFLGVLQKCLPPVYFFPTWIIYDHCQIYRNWYKIRRWFQEDTVVQVTQRYLKLYSVYKPVLQWSFCWSNHPVLLSPCELIRRHLSAQMCSWRCQRVPECFLAWCLHWPTVQHYRNKHTLILCP